VTAEQSVSYSLLELAGTYGCSVNTNGYLTTGRYVREGCVCMLETEGCVCKRRLCRICVGNVIVMCRYVYCMYGKYYY
jgi:hypothetical protein